MPGTIELGTDKITSLSRGNGKVKSQLNSIFKIIETKANVPKQFSAAGNGRFRDVGIGNPWEKEDLNKTNPPGDFTLKEPKTLRPTLTSTGWFEEEPFAQRRRLQYPVLRGVDA